MGEAKDSKDLSVETSSLSLCSTKSDIQQAKGEPSSSAATSSKMRTIFRREEKEPVPKWKLEQEREFKEWNKSM